MKNRLAKNIQLGFTLVELLVVIGILGILAAALLAVIDPIEQLNKANDTSKKNLAVEYVGAMQRYYAKRQTYPMSVTGCGSGTAAQTLGAAPNGVTIASLGGPTGTNCTAVLIINGELKATYASASNIATGGILSTINVGKIAAGDPVVACFVPTSKAYKLDPLTNYTDVSDAMDGAGACTVAVNSTCSWCAR